MDAACRAQAACRCRYPSHQPDRRRRPEAAGRSRGNRRHPCAGAGWRQPAAVGALPHRLDHDFPELLSMLIGIPALLGPELLAILRAMGHGDEIALVDGNYPAEEQANRLVRADGLHLIPVLDAILSVL